MEVVVFLPRAGLGGVAATMRVMRGNLLDTHKSQHVMTARAKGLGEIKIYLKHILKVISTTLITVVGLQVGGLMSGAVLTESVFSWPGMGSYLIKAIDTSSYPVIQDCILFFAIVFIVVHFLVDVLYVLMDPRLKEGK